jgi:threonine synthase
MADQPGRQAGRAICAVAGNTAAAGAAAAAARKFLRLIMSFPQACFA